MGKEQITSIPYTRKCFYAIYANLPTTGVRIGDLGYATDRLVLYRWNGAAWEYLTFHFSSGLAANIPVADDLPNGSCYYTTDTKLLRQVQSGAWATILQPTVSPLTICDTEVFNAATPTAWTDLALSGTVGAQATLVVLKVSPTADVTIAFRKNGDTDEHYISASDAGTAIGQCKQDIYHIFVIPTDDAGIIEWKASAAIGCQVKVILYIK